MTLGEHYYCKTGFSPTIFCGGFTECVIAMHSRRRGWSISLPSLIHNGSARLAPHNARSVYIAGLATTISELIPQDTRSWTYSICHFDASSNFDRRNGLHPPTSPGLRS